MPLPVDRHWHAAARCLDRILEARATADSSLPAVAAEPLWPLAAGIRTALDQIARSAPLAGLQRLDDIFWSRHDELLATLASARERAAAAREAALKHCADLEECRIAAIALNPGAADADRTMVTGFCTHAWRRAVARWSDDTDAAYDTASCRQLLTALDGLPRAWRRTLERHQATARTTAADADAVIDRLDQAVGLLAAAYQAWCAIHEDPQGTLSVTVRAYLRATGAALASAGQAGPLLSDLDDLYRGEPELRIPVVAPMKAGKSTLLSALLGLDIVPRRAQVMTAVPTRFIPVPPDRQAEPQLELPEPMVASYQSLLDTLTAVIGESKLAALATNPHLHSVASRLQRGDRVLVAAAHTGPLDIRTVLTWLHDTTRLATVLLPAELTDVIAEWRPEVTVPVPGAPSAGRLALIDTPGPGEAEAAPVFQKIMNTQLADAHGCLVVIDFAQILGTAEAALAELIAGHAGGYQPPAIAIAVNRIDQRRDGDLDGDQVLRVARQLFDLDGWADVPVVETAAARALAALMYQRTADPDSQAELLRIAYPVRPPARAPSQGELEEIARTLLGDSGVTELRGQLLGRVSHTLPRLTMEHALTRAGGQAAGGVTDLIAGARWAAAMASRITRSGR